MLRGLPAVPLQRPGRDQPVVHRGLAERGNRETDRGGHVVRGDRQPGPGQRGPFRRTALDTELVALRIGERRPAPSVRLAVVGHEGGAQAEQPLDLLVPGAVLWLDVQMETVLGALRLRYRDEQQCGTRGFDECLGIAGRVIVGERRAEHPGPEAGELVGVGAVDRDVTYE